MIEIILNVFLVVISGFSVISGVLLLCAYFFIYPFKNHAWTAKAGAVLLLGGVVVSQTSQLVYLFVHLVRPFSNPLMEGASTGSLAFAEAVYHSTSYSMALMLSAAGFCLLGREVVAAQNRMNGLLVLQAVLLVSNLFVANTIILPLGFLLGLFYSAYLLVFIWRYRIEHKRQSIELYFFAGFAAMALILLMASLVALTQPLVMLLLYATLVCASLLCIQLTLLKSPYWVVDVQEQVEANRMSYNKSTLAGMDSDSLIRQFNRLMKDDKPYLDQQLSLSQMAALLGVSTHQLSELVNTELSMGFSQILRQYRVEEAKQRLLDEPDASILSIGLSVGFASQSNFYTAFKDVEKRTPGAFRKRGH